MRVVNGSVVSSLAVLAMLALAVAPAAGELVLWEEDFCEISEWTTYQASLTCNGNTGTLTADVDWGKMEPASWTVAEFGCGPDSDSLYVTATAVTGRFVVKIMEEVPPYDQITLITADTPGTYGADVGDLTGWVGLRSFKLVVYVEWATPASATFDHIKMINADGWADDFEPIAVGWRDDDTNPGFNATITDISGPYATVSEVIGVTWGKVLSPVLTIDVDAAPTLTAVVVADPALSNFLFAIQEEEPPYAYYELGRGYDAGIFVYDYQTVTGWTGEHTFSIQITVESADIEGWVTLDSIKLDCAEAPPTGTLESSWGEIKSLFR